jgi:hypothetical protein
MPFAGFGRGRRKVRLLRRSRNLTFQRGERLCEKAENSAKMRCFLQPRAWAREDAQLNVDTLPAG